MLSFVEHPRFTEQIGSLMTDEEYARFQQDLAANPEAGVVDWVGCAKSDMQPKVRGNVAVPASSICFCASMGSFTSFTPTPKVT